MHRMILIVGMGCLSLQVQAQSRTTEETGPTAETETVCYAAAGKWICAAKSKQALARQQAAIVNQQEQAEQQAQQDTVQITTVPPVPSFEDVDDSQPAQPLIAESQETETAAATQTSEPAAQPTAQKEQLIEESQPTATSQTSQNTIQNTTPRPAQPSTSNDNSAVDSLEQWLRDYPDDWTVQVIGLSNVQNLDQFFNQYGLNRSDYLVVETVVEAGPWWIVILEHYPNRDAAVAAKSRLPAALASQAWVRPINGIPLP